MSTLYERIVELCKTKKVSASRMCLDLGLSKSTMSGMKSGRTKGISISTAKKIANYFGITVDELYGEQQKEKPIAISNELSEKVFDLINSVKELPEEKVELLLQLAKSIKQEDR